MRFTAVRGGNAMLYVIDGTGAEGVQEYSEDMALGFMARMRRQYGGVYFRGPTKMDTTRSSLEIYHDVLGAILADKRFGKEPLYLAGHSRGGFVALQVAQGLLIGKHKMGVKAMFLFDAVDRSSFSDRRKLPASVQICYHAKRASELTNYATSAVEKARNDFLQCAHRNKEILIAEENRYFLDDEVDTWPEKSPCAAKFLALRAAREEDYKYKYAMRAETKFEFPDWFVKKYPMVGATIDFGNTLEDEKPSARYIEKRFLGSHGAMGGAPLKDARTHSYLLSIDAKAVTSVWEWMTGNFAAAGLAKVETTKPGGVSTDEVYKHYNESFSGAKH
jgi:thioesterase domain-containing protein